MRRDIAILLLSATWLCPAQTEVSSLEQVAKVATVMLDGDVCLRIQTPRSVKYSQTKDPRDPWRASDNYDVEAAAFTQIKKTLIRLSHLCPETCDVNLWMPVPSRADRVQLTIRNVHEWSQFWTWGDLDTEMPPEMADVLKTARPVTVRHKPGMTSALAPVYDSLGDVAGVVEVVSQKNSDPRENVK